MAIRSEESIYENLSFCQVGAGYVFDTDNGKVIARCIVNDNWPEAISAYQAYHDDDDQYDNYGRPKNFFAWYWDTYDEEPGEILYEVTYHDPDIEEPEYDSADEADPYCEYNLKTEEMDVDALASLLSGMREVAGYHLDKNALDDESIY